MRLLTYQSQTVYKILKNKQIYRAKPSLSFAKEYGALIDMLKLNCECPVFAVVKGRKQNSSGRVSGAVRIELEVPDDQIKFTEFSIWADFLYAIKFVKNSGYKKVSIDYHAEVSQKKHDKTIRELSAQKAVGAYHFPQAILEEIRPEWVVSHKRMPRAKGAIDFGERLLNLFRM